MVGRRTYGEGCAVSHALDVIGERWALVVVRELLLGPKRFTDLLRLFDEARALIVVQPNFSHALTERTLTAMQRGAVVLSTPNAFLDEHFVDGEDYLRIDGSWADLDEKIASLADARRTDAIAEAAWRKVTKRFSPEATVARYLEFAVPAAKAAR